MTDLDKLRELAQRWKDAATAEVERVGVAGAVLEGIRSGCATELMALLDSLPPVTSPVPLTEATRKSVMRLVEQHASARVQGELAYGRDASPALLHKYDEQDKKAWREIEEALRALYEARS